MFNKRFGVLKVGNRFRHAINSVSAIFKEKGKASTLFPVCQSQQWELLSFLIE